MQGLPTKGLLPRRQTLLGKLGLFLVIPCLTGLVPDDLRGETLISCEGSPGDLIDRGFYIAEYPGHSLGTVTLEFAANTAGDYTLSLTARKETYDGEVIASPSERVELSANSNEGVPVTFNFGNVPIEEFSTVTFEINQEAGPTASVFYAVPAEDTSCPVSQTNGTSPPLDTHRRQGVKIEVTGNSADLFVESGESIQAAIDAADSGQTVRVAEGTFQESFSMRSGVDVVGAGKAKTTVEGNGDAIVTADEATDTKLEGFHFTWSGEGQPTIVGIDITGGDPMITGNKITGTKNGIAIGGGSSAIVQNNFVCDNGNTDNEIIDYGIVNLHSTPLIANNRVCRNEVGIYIAWKESAGTRVINNTVAQNENEGIWCYSQADATIKNNIVVNNNVGIAALSNAKPKLSYNNVWNSTFRDYDAQDGSTASAGVGSISADPLFDESAPDRFLLTEGSPCIDAGDPRSIFDDPDGSRNDMGYTGGPSGTEGVRESPVASGFVFTSVGNIPVSQITQNGTGLGLANVSDAAAGELSIPDYNDAPFGGKIWLNGLFGEFDGNVEFYQILVAPWSGRTPPDSSAFEPLDDPLTKVRYFVSSSGRVDARRVNVGPDEDGLYERTEEGYWAHPDLKMIWNTRRFANGIYQVKIKAFDKDKNEVSLPSNEQDSITLVIDNAPVTAKIVEVRHDSSPVPECGIIDLSSETENIAFKITASHPNGYLHSFNIGVEYGSNKNGGRIVRQQYEGENDGSRPTWNGVTETVFNSTDSGNLDPWHTCAYQFDLRARARTTTGFGRIYRDQFDENLTLELSEGSSGASADLDGDGDVDGDDLAIFASQFGGVNAGE